MVGNLISRALSVGSVVLGLGLAVFGGSLLIEDEGGVAVLAAGLALLGAGGHALVLKRCQSCGLVLHGAWTCESCGHAEMHDLD